MALEHVHALQKAVEETEPNKLEGLSLQALQSYYERLSAILPYLLDGRLVTSCRDRIELLRREIEIRRIEERSERQHQEAYGIGKKTLTWARIGGVAGIVMILVGVVYLIYDNYFSKVQPATSARSSPAPPLQMTTPTSGLPEPEASSNSATPLVKPAATITPSPITPPKN